MLNETYKLCQLSNPGPDFKSAGTEVYKTPTTGAL